MRDGRLEGFDRLCRSEYAGVVRTAYLITGDREEAVDLAQEAFARAYERWKTVSKLDLMDALDSLTPAQRTAIVLRYYADQPVDGIAKALGKAPGTVRALTSQGLARLREFLGQEETDDARR